MKPARKELRGELRHDEPMARHTSWHVGGKADLFFQPADIEDLQLFLRRYLDADQPLHWVGLGSNLLIRDGGIRGAVICTAKVMKNVFLCADGSLWAEVGLSCAKLARFCARNHLAKAEFFAGIPGTLGGALAMNAGAWGGETWDHVREVETIDRSGAVRLRRRDEFTIGYRSVGPLEGEWFIGGRWKLPHGDQTAIRNRISRLLDQRGSSQPLQLFSAGSVFRNPPGHFAARLIEDCGLKGYRLGGAEVSNKHANFIINRDHASAADIEALIHLVQDRVLHDKGIRLEPEIRILGATE